MQRKEKEDQKGEDKEEEGGIEERGSMPSLEDYK